MKKAIGIPDQQAFDTLKNHVENSLLSLWFKGMILKQAHLVDVQYVINLKRESKWVLVIEGIPEPGSECVCTIAEDLDKLGYTLEYLEIFTYD